MTINEAKSKLATTRESFISDNIEYQVCIVPSKYDEMVEYLSHKRTDKKISPITFSSNNKYKLIGWRTDGVNVIHKSIPNQHQ